MDDKLYIKKFIRDDGEKLSFDGEQLYLAQENTLLVRPDPSTTAVNFTEADGGEMIHQQNTTYDQPVNGLIIPKSTDYWTLTKQLSLFFKVNHTYKIVYIKKDGSMFAVSNAWISSGLQIVPVPHEEYSEWSITMTIGNVNWTEYAEDSQGNEIYSNTITLPLLSSATGGEEWEYQEQDAVSGEGSEIELDTDLGATVTDLDIKGDTFQQTYTGKNLFGGLTYEAKSNITSWDLTNNILTITPSYIDKNPGITFSFSNSLPAGTYTLNSNNYISSSTQLRENAGSMGGGANFNNNYSEVTRTTTASTSYITFNWVATGSLDPFTVDLSTLQIVAGSTAGSYEPYVGGVPAPNPDYPQDIDVVTGEQTVWVHGKNIFSGQYSQFDNTGGTGSTYAYFKLPDDGVYQLTLIAKNAVTANDHTYLGFTSTGGSTTNPRSWAWQDHMTANAGDIITKSNIVSDTNLRYVSLYGKSADTLTWFTDNFYIMLEKAEVATTYKPYQGSATYTIDLGSTELCKIGTYQDYIYKSGDDWYVHKKCGKVVLTGSNNETWSSANSNALYRYENATSTPIQPETTEVGAVMSNYYIANTYSDCYNSRVDYGVCLQKTNPYICIRNKDIVGVSALRQWLSNNNTTVYYALATPTDTKITDSDLIDQLDALYTMQGYNEKTIITVSTVSTNQPAILAVTLQNPPITGEVWDNVGTVWELGSGGPQTINIDSTTTVYPVWVVQGPCINPTLQNNTTDTLAQYDGTVAAGQTLTVDFAEGTAHLDSALVTRYISGLVSLRPGDNTLGFNSDGGTTETSTISWNNVIN